MLSWRSILSVRKMLTCSGFTFSLNSDNGPNVLGPGGIG